MLRTDISGSDVLREHKKQNVLSSMVLIGELRFWHPEGNINLVFQLFCDIYCSNFLKISGK